MKEDVLYRSFDTLSYGEQTKVLLGALFVRENKFLLIDEPTNHLDLEGDSTWSPQPLACLDASLRRPISFFNRSVRSLEECNRGAKI